ncbi:PD40 domain-containing protein [Brevibacillus fortis]|uniref:Translocation protein TolB n=1 Tax=Brevibacillus fortis TaxID=2126352 RepID=A0A2P7VBH7_9BACL|nr:PD40 domain-containing protein [Brevibacillus fortis]PSJ96571.1 hypothetical protein C7R93_10275 [Brevibacillus fortis]
MPVNRKWGKLISLVVLLVVLVTANGEAKVAAQSQGPERVNKEINVPAKIAFTSNQHLFLVDGRDASGKIKQITKDGYAEIVGWSPDGKWLLFVKHKGNDNYSTPGYVWIVSADGSKAVQVDERAVYERPKWSPKANELAYTVNIGSNEEPRPLLIVKDVQDYGELALQSTTKADFADFAWMPDGENMLVSLPAEKNKPMTLALRTLAGKPLAAYPIAEPPKVEEGIYLWAATGLKVSPDGKAVAYFVRYNSGSLSADGVPIQRFDLTQPGKKPIELGTGLAYPDWLAWAPNSEQLAFIDGTDRIATTNKQLKLADRAGKVKTVSPGPIVVDTYPVWIPKAPYSLLFTRGLATPYSYDPKKVMVPEQGIWRRSADGAEQQVTKGEANTADYYPASSPDGKQLLFLRLDQAEHGSLFVQGIGEDADKQIELIKDITGDIGYYANYLPPWVSVYWE